MLRQEYPRQKMVSTQINNFSHSYQYLEWFHLIIIFSNTPHKTTIMDKLSILHLSTCTRLLYSYKIVHMAPSLIVSLYYHPPQALTPVSQQHFGSILSPSPSGDWNHQKETQLPITSHPNPKQLRPTSSGTIAHVYLSFIYSSFASDLASP